MRWDCSLKLMYRHFNKPYVLLLYVLLFSLFQCASTIVTYMIVLLQFDQSHKSRYECNRNVTNWVKWSLEFVCVMWPRKLHNILSLLSLLLYYYNYQHDHQYYPGIIMPYMSDDSFPESNYTCERKGLLGQIDKSWYSSRM